MEASSNAPLLTETRTPQKESVCFLLPRLMTQPQTRAASHEADYPSEPPNNSFLFPNDPGVITQQDLSGFFCSAAENKETKR